MTRDDEILDALRRIADGVEALRRENLREARALLSIAQASRVLGIGHNRTARLVAAGLISGVRDGTRIRVPRAEVDRVAREGIPREPGRRGRPRKPLPSATTAEAIRSIPID